MKKLLPAGCRKKLFTLSFFIFSKSDFPGTDHSGARSAELEISEIIFDISRISVKFF